MLAALVGRTSVAKLLMEAGADTRPRNVHGGCALDVALHMKHRDAATAIAQFMAKNKIMVYDAQGNPPIISWMGKGDPSLVKLMVDAGMDTAQTTKQGFSPLQCAATAGNVEVVRILLDGGADIEQKDPVYLSTPLQTAIFWDKPNVVQLLLDRGASIYYKNRFTFDAMGVASSKGLFHIVTMIQQRLVAPPEPKPTPKPAPAPAPAPVVTKEGKGKGGHLMISYNWGHQTELLKIRDALKERGYDVWMDVDEMSGATMDAMAEAVEDAAAVLLCFSKKYKESKNCMKEAKYSETRNKHIIPLKMEDGYTPDGWLGFLLGDRLYFDFSGKYPFDKKFEELVKEIGDRGKLT